MLAIQSCGYRRCKGLSKDIAQKILAKKADYILMVKDNQKGLKQQIEKVFTLKSLPTPIGKPILGMDVQKKENVM
jgi:predicted transposase YbfD/YdcC